MFTGLQSFTSGTRSSRRWRRVFSHGLFTTMLLVAVPVNSHEFWLEAIRYQPAVGDSVPIVQRVGMEFEGLSYPYLKEDTRRFSLITADGEQLIDAIEGDDPAAEVTFKKPGLTTIVYYGAANYVEFDTFAKFEDSLKFEHLDAFVGRHLAAGKPQANIKEQFARCAKSLIGVGRGDGADRAIGMPLELVAEANPYKIGKGEPLPVQLLHEGKPLAGVTVKIFSRERAKDPERLVTDANGRVSVTLPKRGEYMVHAVHMREPRDGEPADWVSLWASLTFLRP